jgi:hypothetical protein
MGWPYVRPGDEGAPDCLCGCPAADHDHYRPGTDCGLCGNRVCEVYRPRNRGPWVEPPQSRIDDAFEIGGWTVYGSPLPNVRPT